MYQVKRFYCKNCVAVHWTEIMVERMAWKHPFLMVQWVLIYHSANLLVLLETSCSFSSSISLLRSFYRFSNALYTLLILEAFVICPCFSNGMLSFWMRQCAKRWLLPQCNLPITLHYLGKQNDTTIGDISGAFFLNTRHIHSTCLIPELSE